MTEGMLSLSTEERGCLLRLLESTLASKRVEVHRTDSLEYKQYLEHDLDLIEALIAKLRPGAEFVKAV